MAASVNNLDPEFRPLLYVAIVSFMAPLFGFNLGFIIAFKTQLINLFMLESDDIDTLVGTFILGTMVGSFFGGWLNYSSGRKISIIGGLVLGLAGEATCLLAPDFSLLLLSEFVVGASFGIYMLSSIIYICEISSPLKRNVAGVLIAVMVLSGALFVTVTREILPSSAVVMVAVITVYESFFVAVALVKLPESPRWLALSGLSDPALSVLLRLRGDSGRSARELSLINECCHGEDRGIDFFIHSEQYRRVIWFLVFITLLMQLSGFSIIPYVFLQIVHDNHVSFLEAVQAGYDYDYGLIKSAVTVGLFGAICSAFTLNRLGSRSVIIYGVVIALFSLLFLFFLTFFELKGLKSLFLGSFLLIFIFGVALSYTAFITSFATEILPQRGRDLGLAVVMLVNFVAFLSVQQSFEFLTSMWHISGWFAFCLLSIIVLLCFLYKVLPETSGYSLEEIEHRIFRGGGMGGLN
ncbi:MAG: MFS transporter [Succinivibrio sp.]|nr:MFS transporter [Succinivibrio sp.]